MINLASQEPFNCFDEDEKHNSDCRTYHHDFPSPKAASDAKCSGNPNRRRGSKATDGASFTVPQDYAGPDKADARHNTLQNTLHNSTESIGVLGHSWNLNGSDAHDGCA